MKNLRLLFSVILFISFHSAHSLDYYWVGGSGDWTDVSNHWSKTSGALDPHVKVPGFEDNVVFDANSFTAPGQTVTIINNNASCKDMTWTGVTNNPALEGYYYLYIYGSLTLDTGMTIDDYYGEVYFKATTGGKTITMAGNTFDEYVIFNGVGGGWTLQDTFRGYLIDFVNGDFNTNNNNVFLKSGFISTGTNTRTINLGTSTIDINPAVLGWDVNSTGLTLIANQSTFNIHEDGGFTCGGSQVYNNINFINSTTFSNSFRSGAGSTFNLVSFSSSCSMSGSSLQFTQINCGGSGTLGISGSTVQDLILTAGKRYFFSSFNVTNLTANGSCNGYIELRSIDPLFQVTINNTSNNSVDRAIIESVNITPAPNNNATNSIDLGNNAGWTFTTPTFNTCYWVGDEGSWSDAAKHWANTSGGTPGSACVPTIMDNVVFDANSFTKAGQSVTIDIQAYCKDMTWSLNPAHKPNFIGNKYFILSIYGSLTLDPSIANFNMESPVFFKASSAGKTITSTGKAFSNNVFFDGVGGVWDLQDALTITLGGNLTLTNGTLNTNSHTITSTYFYSAKSGNRVLNLGSSIIEVSDWTIGGTNFILNAGTSTIRIRNDGRLSHAATPGKDYYNVEFTSTTQTSYSELNHSIPNGGFNNVNFLGGGRLSSATRINNLILSAGKNYTLKAGATYTITSSFTAKGNCSGFIDMRSTTAGVQSTLNLPAGSTVIEYCVLKDQKVIGSGVYTANNSMDQGNNSGWVISGILPRELFWVGGSGLWSDVNHWSLTPNGAGGACVPTLYDDVYFTQYSFPSAGQTVTVNVIANCKNMSWAGHAASSSGPALNTPAFTSTSFTSAYILNIFGSLTLIANMNWNFTSELYFKASTLGQTLTSANQEFDGYLLFDGVGGEWILQDDLKCSLGVSHRQGIFRTNNKNITASGFGSSKGELYMGSSVFTLGNSNAGSLSINGTNLLLDAGTSTINIVYAFAELYFSSPSATANRLNDINFTNPDGRSGIYTSGGTAYFHNVKFRNWGEITGDNNYNKLIFTPGKNYMLESGSTQTVDTLDARGNPCYRITIDASQPGVQSNISKPSGTLKCDYLELIDQNATGGANFYAGQFSWDVSNNTGWIFNGSDFGLGPDTAIKTCGGTITLSTINFNGTDSTTFLWSNGSTADSLVVSSSGTYWVKADYGSGCLYTDSINVSIDPALINLILSPDVSICEGNSTTLTASGGTSYTWTPSYGLSSTTGASVIASPTVTTSYSVRAQNGICNDTKIITVTVTSASSLSVTPVANSMSGPLHHLNSRRSGILFMDSFYRIKCNNRKQCNCQSNSNNCLSGNRK